MRGKTTADWLAELELGKVKKAGTFLDGCKIFLSGFTEAEQVQLGRVLKFGGAVKLSQVVESISHCVHSVATTTILPHTTKLLANLPDLSPHQVSVQWVVESFKLGRPAPESDFTFPAVTSREDPAESLPPPASRVEVEAVTGAEDTTHFEQRLLAQYGGDMTRTRTGNLSSSYKCLCVTPTLSLQRMSVRSFPFWLVKS